MYKVVNSFWLSAKKQAHQNVHSCQRSQQDFSLKEDFGHASSQGQQQSCNSCTPSEHRHTFDDRFPDISISVAEGAQKRRLFPNLLADC